MEKQTNIENLVIVCAVIAVFIVIAFIIFVIIQKIHRHKLEAAKEILETQNNEEIQRIKKENEQINQDFSNLKKEVQEIREQLKKGGGS